MSSHSNSLESRRAEGEGTVGGAFAAADDRAMFGSAHCHLNAVANQYESISRPTESRQRGTRSESASAEAAAASPSTMWTLGEARTGRSTREKGGNSGRDSNSAHTGAGEATQQQTEVSGGETHSAASAVQTQMQLYGFQ